VASHVSVGGPYSFRNAVQFMPPHRPRHHPSFLQAALDETEAVLDHLLHHDNTPPFVSHLLIQRLVTSNPSHRYVESVATAFITGEYDGRVYSGRYGDLAATVAAILLDREARSSTLDADPAHGLLREPLLKAYHVLRSLEYASGQGQVTLLSGAKADMGQQHFFSPTVFNFYLPAYQPVGPVADAGLVCPEAELGTGPYIVGFLNAMSQAVRGWYMEGRIRYVPDNTEASAAVDQLDFLLTGGRLTPQNREVIRSKYATAMRTSNADAAIKAAQELFLFTSEFHASNRNSQRSVPRAVPAPTPAHGRAYKAIVYIYLAGGADTFNIVAPHSECGSSNLDAQYTSIRGANAIPKASMLPINVSNQPCATFGVHPKLTTLKAAYDDGDAAFFANIGALVQPLTKQQFIKGFPKPPMLFSHDTQRLTAQNVHAQAASSAKGVLGRISAALGVKSPSGQPAHKIASYSIAGNAKILEGGTVPPDMISYRSGAVRLGRLSSLKDDIGKLMGNESGSLFAETYTGLMERSIQDAERLGYILGSDKAKPTATFGTGHLGGQLLQVAKLIKARSANVLDTERDVFYIQLNRWDTHFEIDSTGVSDKWAEVNAGLASFATELKAQGMWENVTIALGSEFGRSLNSNGRGTDHGWGGNTFVMGGAVKGGQMLGAYPPELRLRSPLSIGRALMPTTSWEAMWHGLAQWMGVEDAAMEGVLPNLRKFTECSGQGCGVYTTYDMFKGIAHPSPPPGLPPASPPAPPQMPPPPAPPHSPPLPPLAPQYDAVVDQPDASRTYSGWYGAPNHKTWFAMGKLSSRSGWRLQSNSPAAYSEWAQIDLGADMLVAGAVTRSAGHRWEMWVPSYNVRACTSIVSGTCVSWVDVDGGTTFSGPNATTAKTRENIYKVFAAPVRTRMVRIYPVGRCNWVCAMRVALLIRHAAPPPAAALL